MNIVGQAAVSVTVTIAQLTELVQCSRRMMDYADPDGSLLIATVNSQNGKPVRLVLDRNCIHNRKPKATIFDSS